jgi:hypothetical protein
VATFTKRSLRQLGDVLSTYYVIRTIHDLFEDAGVPFPPQDVAEAAAEGVDGARRSLMWQYLASLDFTDPIHVRRMSGVFEQVLGELPDDEFGQRARERLTKALANDGFQIDAEGKLVAVAGRRVQLALNEITDAAALREHLDRIERELPTDPAGAISSAKALIESTAKIVLTKTGNTYDKNVKFPRLVADTHKALGLHAGTLAPDKAGDDTLKMILDGLYKVAVGIDELRNRYGRDHGRAEALRGLSARHAHLAVHSATAYCRFLLDTLTDPTAPWQHRLPAATE